MSTLTHCKRELFHECLAAIFNNEFSAASQKGIRIRFPDGIERQAFLRVVTYSADYPEK